MRDSGDTLFDFIFTSCFALLHAEQRLADPRRGATGSGLVVVDSISANEEDADLRL